MRRRKRERPVDLIEPIGGVRIGNGDRADAPRARLRGLLARDLELSVAGERFGDDLPSREVERIRGGLGTCLRERRAALSGERAQSKKKTHVVPRG